MESSIPGGKSKNLIFMATIKNIIFDLGGVLLNIDYNKTADAFKQLGATDFDDFYSQSGANEVFEALETGQLDEGAFYAAMQPHCHPGTTYQQIQDAWNAILLDFRKESIAYLDELNNRYRLFLLSNTNSIHHTAFHQSFAKEIGEHAFDDYFEKAWYSHLIGMRKPYAATYQYVLNQAGLSAGDTLFIDDSIINIEGAKSAGLQTHYLLKNEQIELIGL